jgi:hypothetical protein
VIEGDDCPGELLDNLGLQRSGFQLRRNICLMLVKHRGDVEPFLAGDFESYLHHMATEGVWGGEPELAMAVKVYLNCLILFWKHMYRQRCLEPHTRRGVCVCSTCNRLMRVVGHPENQLPVYRRILSLADECQVFSRLPFGLSLKLFYRHQRIVQNHHHSSLLSLQRIADSPAMSEICNNCRQRVFC